MLNPEEFPRVFIQCISHYFERTVGEIAVVGTPYILVDKPELKQYTGSIPISGEMSGSVVYTLDPELLGKVMKAWGENQPTEELLNDVVGEIANTIAGNAREELGKDFVISVPQIVDGESPAVEMLEDGINLGIPVKVNGLESQLYLTLKQPN